jgi:hypothetical protein
VSERHSATAAHLALALPLCLLALPLRHHQEQALLPMALLLPACHVGIRVRAETLL